MFSNFQLCVRYYYIYQTLGQIFFMTVQHAIEICTCILCQQAAYMTKKNVFRVRILDKEAILGTTYCKSGEDSILHFVLHPIRTLITWALHHIYISLITSSALIQVADQLQNHLGAFTMWWLLEQLSYVLSSGSLLISFQLNMKL